MAIGKDRIALQLYAQELGKFVSLLSHEAAGVALRICDMQFRTGRGLPDGKNTHNQLGLTKRRWDLLREELLRVLVLEDGHFVYPLMKEMQERRSDARQKGLDTIAKKKAIEAAPKPAPVKAVVQKPVERPIEEPGSGSPIPPFAVFDAAEAALAKNTNVIRMPGVKEQPDTKSAPPKHRAPAQGSLPGIAKNPAADAAHPDDLQQAKQFCFSEGVKLLVRFNGITEDQARQRIGKMLTEYSDVYVAAAIGDAVKHRHDVVNPTGWIRDKLKAFPDKATERANRMAGKKKSIAKKVAPKATPAYMGISEAKAKKLRERSAAIRGNLKIDVVGHEPANDDLGFATAAASQPKTDEQIFKPIAL